jgi:hypothetical protein
MTSSTTPSSVPWDLSFLRVGTLATATAAALAAPVAGLVGGWSSAWGVLAGVVVVTAFFCLSGLVIAWAGRIGDALTLPAALGTFMVKILVLALILGAIPPDGGLDRLTLAWTVIGATLLWGAVQMRWVWTRQLYYVPPPAAPPAPQSLHDRVPVSDPEKPASRG